MRYVRRWRPTPAMIVALVALVVATAGTALAGGTRGVTAARHPRHARHLDAGADATLVKRLAPGLAVRFARSAGRSTSAASADAAVTAASADRAATATRAAEADHAGNADQLGGLGPAEFERAGHLVPISLEMSNSEPDKTLLSAGPFVVTGHCAPANPLQNVIGASLTTSENDSAFHGRNTFGSEVGNSDFDVGTQEQISLYQESGSPPSPAGPFPATLFMSAPSGAQVALTLTLATRVFSDNPSQRVACAFGGYAVVR